MEINKDKLIIYGAAAAFLIIAVCMFIPEKKAPEKAEEKPKNETTNIPDGETQEVNKSKMQGYESADQGRNRNSAADIYWNSQPETQITHEQVRQNSQEIFGTGNPTPSVGYTAPPTSNPYRETAEEREARAHIAVLRVPTMLSVAMSWYSTSLRAIPLLWRCQQ
ncbi:MAG: hypothetical protein II204_08440 [Alistipes sp.]|nr:hypothetical protein [Alistipes sp.]